MENNINNVIDNLDLSNITQEELNNKLKNYYNAFYELSKENIVKIAKYFPNFINYEKISYDEDIIIDEFIENGIFHDIPKCIELVNYKFDKDSYKTTIDNKEQIISKKELIEKISPYFKESDIYNEAKFIMEKFIDEDIFYNILWNIISIDYDRIESLCEKNRDLKYLLFIYNMIDGDIKKFLDKFGKDFNSDIVFDNLTIVLEYHTINFDTLEYVLEKYDIYNEYMINKLFISHITYKSDIDRFLSLLEKHQIDVDDWHPITVDHILSKYDERSNLFLLKYPNTFYKLYRIDKNYLSNIIDNLLSFINNSNNEDYSDKLKFYIMKYIKQNNKDILYLINEYKKDYEIEK